MVCLSFLLQLDGFEIEYSQQLAEPEPIFARVDKREADPIFARVDKREGKNSFPSPI